MAIVKDEGPRGRPSCPGSIPEPMSAGQRKWSAGSGVMAKHRPWFSSRGWSWQFKHSREVFVWPAQTGGRSPWWSQKDLLCVPLCLNASFQGGRSLWQGPRGGHCGHSWPHPELVLSAPHRGWSCPWWPFLSQLCRFLLGSGTLQHPHPRRRPRIGQSGRAQAGFSRLHERSPLPSSTKTCPQEPGAAPRL